MRAIQVNGERQFSTFRLILLCSISMNRLRLNNLLFTGGVGVHRLQYAFTQAEAPALSPFASAEGNFQVRALKLLAL